MVSACNIELRVGEISTLHSDVQLYELQQQYDMRVMEWRQRGIISKVNIGVLGMD